MRSFVTALTVVGSLSAAPPDGRSVVADRVMTLTRSSSWTLVASVPIAFRTFHPQGMVKIGETLFVSSVEVIDRDAGKGVGHLFKIDMTGHLLADLRLGEGAIYHPGGIDYDGHDIWVPVAEYRPDSRSIVYRVDPATMTATEVFRVADHIGAIVHDTDDHTLHGVSWGSRRFYRWTLRGGRQRLDAQPVALSRLSGLQVRRQPAHALHRRHRDPPDARAPHRSGSAGIDLIALDDGRPLHQVPVLLWTAGGLDMTHNPVWIEPSASGGLRAYFMPEDDRSTLYIYDVR